MKTTTLEKKIASCEKIIAKLESRKSKLLTRQAFLYVKTSLLLGYRVECGVLGPYSPMSSLPVELYMECLNINTAIVNVATRLAAERANLVSLQAALSEACREGLRPQLSDCVLPHLEYICTRRKSHA